MEDLNKAGKSQVDFFDDVPSVGSSNRCLAEFLRLIEQEVQENKDSNPVDPWLQSFISNVNRWKKCYEETEQHPQALKRIKLLTKHTFHDPVSVVCSQDATSIPLPLVHGQTTFKPDRAFGVEKTGEDGVTHEVMLSAGEVKCHGEGYTKARYQNATTAASALNELVVIFGVEDPAFITWTFFGGLFV
jgi:hypothetical protein